MATRPRAGIEPDTFRSLVAEGDPVFAPLRDALRPAYQLLRKLGEGGMGAVYMAREPALKRDVAVKSMLPWLASDPTARARFEREAQAVAAISHPNVINIYGTGELADGTPYFVMQFVSGKSLETRVVEDGPLSQREARRVLAEVAAALAAAHKRGIIHRDIKSANVLQDIDSGRVIVTDFGIAAVRDSAEQPNVKLTQPETGSPGTPFSMAPEQLLGEQATEASDVYAFGLLAYELLTGSGPFKASSPAEVAAAHLRDVPKPISASREDIDAELEQLIAATLAKDPAQRPTAAQLMQSLPPGEALSLEWPPPGLDRLAGRLPRLSRRLGAGVAVVVTAVLLLVLADPSSGPLVPLWLTALAALLGWLLVLTETTVAARTIGDMRRAHALGYPWLAIMEVAADARGDTGALITGLREYAPLGREVRSRLRALRLARAGASFLTAIAPLAALLLMIRAAARGSLGSPGIVLGVVLPFLVLLDVVWLLRLAERRAVHVRVGRRGRGRGPRGVLKHVVRAWSESFDTARSGQPLDARAARPFPTRLALRLLTLFTILGMVALAPFVIVPVLMTALAGQAVPKFSGSVRRVLPAVAGAPWTPRPDSALDPVAAGRVLHSLELIGEPRVPQAFLEPDPYLSQPFLEGRDVPVPFWSARAQDSLIALGARRAFTPVQRAWLERLAANPAWPLVHRAARIDRADVVRTRYRPGALDSVPTWVMPIPQLARIKDVAAAANAVAALRLAQGRPEEAEAVLQDAAGFGLVMMRNEKLLIETMIGASIANASLDHLAAFYDVTGRPAEGARIRAARDAARADAERYAELEDARAARSRNTAALVRQVMIRMVSDTLMPPSFRWEFVRQVSFLPCLNSRELAFGPGEEIRETLARFSAEQVRTTGDSLWFRKQTTEPLFLRAQGRPSRIARAYGTVLGNPRIAGCIDIFF